MAEPRDIREILREMMLDSPMKTAIVSSDEEAEKVIKEMEEKGLRWAATSNTGLQEPKRRMTFLPKSAFKEPSPLPQAELRYVNSCTRKVDNEPGGVVHSYMLRDDNKLTIHTIDGPKEFGDGWFIVSARELKPSIR